MPASARARPGARAGDERLRQRGRADRRHRPGRLPGGRPGEAGAVLMSATAIAQLVVLVGLVVVTMGPLGRYMATVYGTDEGGDRRAPGDRVFGPIERAVYRAARIDPDREQRWTAYAGSVLAFSLASAVGLYGLLRLQGHLPGNPDGRSSVS